MLVSISVWIMFSKCLIILSPLFWTLPLVQILKLRCPKLDAEFLCRIYQHIAEQKDFTHYKLAYTSSLVFIFLITLWQCPSMFNLLSILVTTLFHSVAFGQPFLILDLCSWFFAPKYRIFYFFLLDCGLLLLTMYPISWDHLTF